MQKKITLRSGAIIFLTGIILIISAILVFSACVEESPAVSPVFYTVAYSAGEGGSVNGETVQKIEKGKNASPVTAVAEDGYEFSKWSDGVTEAEREDKDVGDNLFVFAVFVKQCWNITYTSNNYKASDLTEPLTLTAEYGSITGINVVPAVGYKFVRWSDGVTSPTRIDNDSNAGKTIEAIFEIEELSLPVFIVNTQDGQPILDKENYVTCEVTVRNTDKEFCFEQAAAGIRGRGNTTWNLSKKPYKLKFDKKVDLFGNGKAKKWTLIANHADPSLIRNYMVYSLGAEESGLLNNVMYTTKVEFVELFLNNEYLGVYLVCEQVEAGSTRVDIDEDIVDKDGNINVNVGYLLESDNSYAASEGIENQDYFRINDKVYAIKSPDTEEDDYLEHKEEFVGFIKQKTTEAINTIMLENTVENYEQVKRLVDINSFVDGYIIDELVDLADREYSSYYIFYDSADGKFYRGPIWDYDSSIGNAAYHYPGGESDKMHFEKEVDNTWYYNLLKFDEFKQAVIDRLNELKENDNFENFVNQTIDLLLLNYRAFERNFLLWDILGKNEAELANWNSEPVREIDTWKGQVEFVRKWLLDSFKYLYSYYN